MFKETGRIDAASILLNLTDYRAITVTQEPDGRQVLIEPIESETAGPSCGILISRIKTRPLHQIKDLPIGCTYLQANVRKRQLACQEAACPRRPFVQTTEQLPFRARLTTHLPQKLVDEMSCKLRAVSQVASAY